MAPTTSISPTALTADSAVMEAWASNPKLRMKQPDRVRRKVQKLISDGCSLVRVVADFDKTLSRANLDDRKTKSSFSAFENDPVVVSDEVRAVCHGLLRKYYPIEVDPNLTREEKIPHMLEWWGQSHTQLVSTGVKPEQFCDVARRADIHLRCRTIDMLKLLHENDVPCLVFSAGLGDIVRWVLLHNGALLPNMTLLSNFFTSKDGLTVEMPQNILHTFNKNGEYPPAQEYFAREEVRSRKNAILLGDMLGDCHMVDGAPGIVEEPQEDAKSDESQGDSASRNWSTVLKIGFLNEQIDERLSSFLDHFDIVLLDDQTMDVPLELIKAITGSHRHQDQ